LGRREVKAMAAEAAHTPAPKKVEMGSARSPTQKEAKTFGSRMLAFLLAVELALFVTLLLLGPVFQTYASNVHIWQVP
jgi:hypothetical protein